MKKLLVVLSIALGISAAAVAQPRAIGARFMNGGEISYQHGLGSNFLEADLGWWSHGAVAVSGIYNFVIASPQWTPGSWNVYAGPGANVFLSDGATSIGVCGQVGLEYTFASVPLQLSLDVRPNVISINDGGLHLLDGIYPGFGIRYAF